MGANLFRDTGHPTNLCTSLGFTLTGSKVYVATDLGLCRIVFFSIGLINADGDADADCCMRTSRDTDSVRVNKCHGLMRARGFKCHVTVIGQLTACEVCYPA